MIRIVVCGVLLLGALACTDSEPTQLVVLVNSDFRPVTELAQVRIAVAGGGHTVEQGWTMVRRDPGKDEAVIPFSFGVVPPGGDAAALVDISVTGLDPEKDTLVRRRVRVGFVPHQLKLLKIDLTHDCAELFEDCEEGGSESAPRTCVSGACDSIDVDVRDLQSIRPGDELVDGGPLPPWQCTQDCDVGGPGSTMRTDAGDAAAKPDDAGDSGPESGMAGMDGGGGSGGNGNGGNGGNGGSGGTGGSSGSSGSSGSGGEGGDGDGGPTEGCGDNEGFFADVEYRLLTTADGTLCPTIAQNAFNPIENPTATLEESTNELHGRIDAALAADLDIIELWVSQSGATLYATGDASPGAALPELGDILDYAPLRQSRRPLKLYFTDAVPDSDQEFATALLSLLLAKQTSEAGGYANDCRPVYLDASNFRALLGLLKVKTLLADDSTYASLRGHLHFGLYVHVYDTALDTQGWLDDLTSAGFEYADISFDHPSALPLVRYAQSKGLHVFAHQALEPDFVPLCGVVDAIGTGRFSYYPGTDFRDAIASSRTLIDLDVEGLASDATQFSYAVAPPGTSEQRSFGPTTPALGTGEVSQALPGTYLSFDAAANQSLALNDPELPAGTSKLAMLVLVRLDADTLPAAGRGVIVSKRQGSSGWALELIDVGGTPQVQFESFVRNHSNGSVVVRQARIPASAFSPGASHSVFAAIDQGPHLRLRTRDDWQRDGVEYEYSIEDNDAPVTLGRDPDATNGYFDGDLQLFKLVSYSY